VFSKPLKIGLISDTHNLVRPEAKRALAGVSLILHAGDICGPEVLAHLGEIAPVIAVRGNNDHGLWAASIPTHETIEVGGVVIYMLHNLEELDSRAPLMQVVVSGHTHRPLIKRKGGALFVNPGSAGPRRFKLPVSLAILEIDNSGIEPRLLTLEC